MVLDSFASAKGLGLMINIDLTAAMVARCRGAVSGFKKSDSVFPVPSLQLFHGVKPLNF